MDRTGVLSICPKPNLKDFPNAENGRNPWQANLPFLIPAASIYRLESALST